MNNDQDRNLRPLAVIYLVAFVGLATAAMFNPVGQAMYAMFTTLVCSGVALTAFIWLVGAE